MSVKHATERRLRKMLRFVVDPDLKEMLTILASDRALTHDEARMMLFLWLSSEIRPKYPALPAEAALRMLGYSTEATLARLESVGLDFATLRGDDRIDLMPRMLQSVEQGLALDLAEHYPQYLSAPEERN